MEGLLLLTRRVLSPRYLFFFILFFFFTTNIIQAKTVVIGAGAGYINVADMTGLNAGDSLAIMPGQYTGGAFNNLYGITITNNGGAVIFTGEVDLNTLVGCVFSGFQFQNIPSIAIRWDGNSRRCTESHIFFKNCAGNTNDASDHNTYTGDTSSLKLYMCTFDSLTLYNSGNVLMGGWGEAKDLECYMDSIVLSRIKVDSTTTNGNEVRGIIFRIDAHDWRITYKGSDTIPGDIGAFFIDGDGSIHDIYKTGGRAYIARIWNVGLKTPGNMYFYNNIDLNCSQYGMLDTRVDPVEFTQYTTGSNCYIFNNTAGNLQEHIGYWSSLAVVGTYALPWICQVKNNLGFNLSTNGKPPITMNQSSGTWITDSSNNMYFTSPAGVVDPVTCVPTDSSPVIGKGLTLSPIVKDDIYHNPRIGAYDIGAVQHGGAIIQAPPNEPPVALVGVAQTLNLPASKTILDGSKSYDPDGTIMSYAWTLVSGPDSSVTIASPSTSTTKLNGLHLGTYIFKLTVTDNSDSTGSALDTIIVNPATTQSPPNIPPVANAGPNQTITAPTNSVNLVGSESYDPDGTITAYSWVTISGPGTVSISNANQSNTAVTGLVPGVYVFQLTVTDDSAATNNAQVTITVNPEPTLPNQAPVANAGSNLTITAPVSSVQLDGSSSFDPDGTIVHYGWNEVSGPSDAGFSNSSAVSPIVTGLVPGSYVFQLMVTDNDGSSSYDQMTVTVNPGVSKPVSTPVDSAGQDSTTSIDQIIVFPNPAHGMIYTKITSSVTGTVHLSIYDMNGRLVLSDQSVKSIAVFEGSLNISSLASGMYMIQVNIGDRKILVTKFIKI